MFRSPRNPKQCKGKKLQGYFPPNDSEAGI
jgi:hypothetical protein